MTHGLFFPATRHAQRISTYSDADYAESGDRKSTSGASHYVYNSLVCCISKGQAIVALSTCEAEYIAASRALQQTLWLRRLLDDIEIQPTHEPPNFKMDNASAIKIAPHQSKTQLRKHIDIRHHHLVQNVRSKDIIVTHTSSKKKNANIMTKPIAKPYFQTAAAALIHPAPSARQPLQTEPDSMVHQGL